MKARWLCLCCISCSAPTAPEAGPGVFEFTLPFAVDTHPRLRAASVWVEGAPQRLTIGEEARVRTATFRLKFELPGSVDLSRLVPAETLVLANGEYQVTNTGHYTELETVRASAYRPRVVVYVDDGDGELDLGAQTADRLVALDSMAGVAVLHDPASAVRKLTLEQAEAYYQHNETNSRFLQVNGYGAELSLSPRAPVPLVSGKHGVVRENVACARVVGTGPSTFETRTRVDASLDVDEHCSFGECSSVVLRELDEPPLRGDLEVERRAQCRRAGSVEALLVSTTEKVCDQCLCSDVITAEAWVAPRAARPDWWPCGEEVLYCADDAAVLLTFQACVIATNEGGRDVDGGALDAGRLDSGAQDSSAPDGGAPDGSALDGATPDAGDDAASP